MFQDSFAIYASNKCEIDMHINVWTNMRNANYIDVGLCIRKKENFNTISIYVPYRILQSDIFDLSEILKSETVMRGIFNQKCYIIISSTESYYDVKFADHCMRVSPIDSCINSISDVGDGTVITLCISQWSEDNIAYIRFRLPFKSLSHYLSSKKHIYIEALESPIMREKYPYNFKLNEARTLPKEVLKTIDNLVVIKTINFFLCVPDKCSVSSDKVHKTRIIESEIFKLYVPDKRLEKNSITYQWKYGKCVKYTLSTFLERKYINWVSVIFYSLAVILLNLISNFLFQMIK